MQKIKAGCCGYRKIQVGQAWSDYVRKVRALSGSSSLTEDQKAQLKSLKEQAAQQRAAFHEHMDDESLVHQ